MNFKLYLVDRNSDVTDAWGETFQDMEEVSITNGNILDIAHTAVVSPSNSNGVMIGGVDKEYSEYFGVSIEARVMSMASKRPEGYLPVGAAAIVTTGDTRIPFLVSAPTMESASTIEPRNVGAAFFAVMRSVFEARGQITALFCPGMGTGVGEVVPLEAAKEMKLAYSFWRPKLLGISKD
jgi:O-acetyl-ADP-ribose deacetylase (regulator of RNase III)